MKYSSCVCTCMYAWDGCTYAPSSIIEQAGNEDVEKKKKQQQKHIKTV